MEPTLKPGQGLLATPYGPAKRGQLRCVQHPGQPGMWLVKRVVSVDGGQMTVGSDNAEVPTIDSRAFGPVPVAGSYRVLLAIPLRFM